jgi:hypothetical protein
LSVHPIHPGKNFRPVLALCTSCTGIDLQHRRKFIFRLIEGAFEFRFFNGFKRLLVSGFDFLFFPLSFFPELEEDGKILYRPFCLIKKVDPVLVKLNGFEDLCGTLVIVPEPRRKRPLSVFVYFILSVSDVKETSSGQQCGPSYP